MPTQKKAVKAHEFTLVLTTVPSETAVEKLYANCQDGTVAIHCGTGQIHFHREAKSLEEAIGSALVDARNAGLSVGRVEMSPEVVALPT